MKKLISIAIVAILTNLIVIPLFNYSNNIPSDEVPFWDNIISVVWAAGIITGLTLTIVYRKYLFKKTIVIVATILALLICTPVPFLVIYRLANPMPDTVLDSADYSYPPGKVHKTEHWGYSWGIDNDKYVDKKFIADSVQFAQKQDAAFKRDSIWVYFSRMGDTIKIEKYKDDKLISCVIKR